MWTRHLKNYTNWEVNYVKIDTHHYEANAISVATI